MVCLSSDYNLVRLLFDMFKFHSTAFLKLTMQAKARLDSVGKNFKFLSSLGPLPQGFVRTKSIKIFYHLDKSRHM